jgi:hypothetical protein
LYKEINSTAPTAAKAMMIHTSAIESPPFYDVLSSWKFNRTQ